MSKIKLGNYSGHDFRGWKRLVIDWEPPAESGTFDGGAYVMGKQSGLDCRVMDLHVALKSGEIRELDFGDSLPPANEVDGDELARPANQQPPSAPPAPSIAGQPMLVRTFEPNGAGFDIHFRTRIFPMLVVDLFVTIYPNQPWADGTLIVTASNPTIPDMVGEIPDNFELTMGPGAVILPQGPLVRAGETMATGQSRPPIPVSIFFPTLANEEQTKSAAASMSMAIAGIGVNRVWPKGNPLWVDGTATQWIAEHYGRVWANLREWRADKLGIKANANTSGSEGDQVFVGSACAQGIPGAELVAKGIAYGYARRPVQHLEPDGSHLDIDGHPDLCFYNGVPFPPGGSTDLLGKPRVASMLETHYWRDWAEHEFFNWLAVAHRMTGDRALQWQIHNQATKWWFSMTMDPRFTTTDRAGNPREWAWKCLAAYHLWNNLDDRRLADRIKERFIDYFPATNKWVGKDLWKVSDASSLHNSGYTDNWMAYQQSPAAYFTHLCGITFNHQPAIDLGLAGAKACIERAYSYENGRWKGWAWVGVTNEQNDELAPLEQGAGAHWGSGVESWHGPAPAVVLHHEPNHEVAIAIRDQFNREYPEQGKWIPPESV